MNKDRLCAPSLSRHIFPFSSGSFLAPALDDVVALLAFHVFVAVNQCEFLLFS